MRAVHAHPDISVSESVDTGGKEGKVTSTMSLDSCSTSAEAHKLVAEVIKQ